MGQPHRTLSISCGPGSSLRDLGRVARFHFAKSFLGGLNVLLGLGCLHLSLQLGNQCRVCLDIHASAASGLV